MAKRKTHEEYVLELAEKNPNIEVMEKYIDSQTPIMHKCKVDGYEWRVRPAKIMYGQGCPKCAGNAKKTTKEYRDELAIKNPSIEVVGEYCGANVKTMHHCLIHDIYWEAIPSRILDGCGCIECKKDKISSSNGKTHEQYIRDVKMANPNVVVLGKYSGINTPILHRCTLHDVEWMPHPISILHGCGCYQCGVDKLKEQKMKTHEQYMNELKRMNPNVIPLEDYAGALNPILHKCIIDSYEWYTTPANALSGKGCPKCAGNAKKTHEEYISQVEMINPNIEVVEKYINAKTPILHKCKTDGYIWKVAPTDILGGSGCPKCAGNLKFTHEEYVKRLQEVNPNIIPLEKYINSTTKIMYKCLIDGYQWRAVPNSTLQGEGCPKCGGKLKKTHEEYVAEVRLINQDIEVIDEYVNAATPIRHRCKIDDYIWYARPDKILHGSGCPQCRESIGERKIRQWLSGHNINYIYQHKFEDCKDKNVLPFDFYIPQYDLCIEYDGIQHFEIVDFSGEGEKIARKKFEYTRSHDNIKNEYCKNNNIQLLRIPYYADIEEELNNFLFI